MKENNTNGEKNILLLKIAEFSEKSGILEKKINFSNLTQIVYLIEYMIYVHLKLH